MVGQLLDHMFAGEDLQESVLVNGITVLQTLLEFRKLGYVVSEATLLSLKQTNYDSVDDIKFA